MALEEVTVAVKDTGGSPVDNVYVGLHNSSSKALLQTDTTGAGANPAGQATFSNVDTALNSGVYEIRIVPAKPSTVNSGKVQNITVLASPSAPLSNIFDITLTQADLPVATDARMCRVSGYFADFTGAAIKNCTFMLSEQKVRHVVYRSEQKYASLGVIPTSVTKSTDKNGYVVFDLIRDSEYSLFMQGYENYPRVIKTPDAASANLADVIFPYVSAIEYYDAGVLITPTTAPAITVASGASKALTYKVILKSGVVGANSEVTFKTSDATKATISSGDGTLTVTGVAAGTPTVTGTRVSDANKGVILSPEFTLNGGTLAVTVT